MEYFPFLTTKECYQLIQYSTKLVVSPLSFHTLVLLWKRVEYFTVLDKGFAAETIWPTEANDISFLYLLLYYRELVLDQ